MAKTPRTSPFAHFFGIGKPATAPRVESDDDKDKDKPERKEGESDDEYAKRCKAAKAKAEAPRENDDNDEGDGAQARAEAATAAAVSSAVAADRARCAEILAHGLHVKRAKHACSLAFDTDMPAATAIACINAEREDAHDDARASAATSLATRMQAENIPEAGADGGPAQPAEGTARAVAAAALRAMDKAMGRV